MPILQINTNVRVPDSKIFTLALSKAFIELFGVPELVTASYTYDEAMTFAGTHEPAFVLTITTLVNPPEKHENASKSFFDFLGKELGVSGDRGYVIYVDPTPINIGYKGTTFDTILKTSKL